MATRDLIPHRLLSQADTRPTAIAYEAKVDGRWQPTTWRGFADQVRLAARALMTLGFPRGGKVALLGFNRPEWVILDHAAMMAGGAAAGIYTTCSADEVQYIVHHSEALVVLVEDAGQLAKLEAKRTELPLMKTIVMMRGAPAAGPGKGVLSWDDFLAKAAATPEAALDARLDAIEQADLATLIYTSGTTGPPKGVMLSHGNLAWTAKALIDAGGGRVDGDVSLSYLPLSHIAEQMATIHMPASTGSTVYFAESLEKIADNLKDCRPTVFFGVPRIWEKFHAAVAAKLTQVTGAKKRLVEWARKTCSAVNAKRDRGEELPSVLALQYALANKLVIRKLKTALGFDRARLLISGAAPIAPDVLEFFASLDMPIREVYGQSEDTGPTSFNLAGKTKIGTVGPPLPGLECKIAEDGEILVRGPNVFLGYFKEPEATAESLEDGWLKSGDLGAFDADGFLTITGRKKEIIITAGGKNVAPKNIEAAIKQSPLVGEAVVIGDRRKFLTALVTLDEDVARKLAPDASNVADAPQIKSAIQVQIDLVNQSLARVEQVKKFAILPKPFGIDSGELTPTMKIKRKVVAQKYASQIEAMYGDGGD
ncbi:MAG: long-chain fatty acid--CoA ligase [Deltaproteobacteria bacterium]|nr:long-chain fatty acid--CoA ligase [Deltaproteobacteria bacterium]MDQ3297367.1 long-chain fatty acid--CoA ligase [Myxococcota bacterium]